MLLVAVVLASIFAVRTYAESENQRQINKRLELTNTSSTSKLEASSKALQDVTQQKTHIESSLKAQEQENAQKQQEIESLHSQLQAKITAKATLAKATAKVTYTSGSVWDQLAQCESGGNWATNTGNGFYGGLQFDIGTWGGYGGFARADLAPPSVQIEKAMEVHARRGFTPWPACKAKLGL
jgi:hypothetical protein